MPRPAMKSPARPRASESLALQARVLESLAEGVSATDEQGVILYSSPSHDRMFGRAPGELLGQSFSSLMAPPAEEKARVLAALAAELEARGEWTGELSHVRKDGTTFITRARVSVLHMEGKRRWVFVQEDISARKAMEAEHREAEARARSLTEVLKDSEARYRQNEERFRFLAQAGERLLASLDVDQTFTTLARLVHEHLAEGCLVEAINEDGTLRQVAVFHHDEAKKELLRTLQRTHGLHHPRSARMQAVLERRTLVIAPSEERFAMLSRDDEHVRMLRALGLTQSVIVPLVARGRSHGVLSVHSDRPGRVFTAAEVGLLDELATRAAVAIDNAHLYALSQEAIRARDSFLSIASHELNTPLTSLKLQLQSLERSLDRLPELATVLDQVAPKFQVVNRQVRRLGNLVSELLDLSRISAGRLKLEPEPVEVVALVREIATRTSEDLTRAGCTLNLLLPERLAGHFDKLRLDQVVTNLVSNAMKYGQGKPIELGLWAVRRDEVGLEGPGGALRLRVTDHGIGMDPAHQDRLFQRFERLASERHYSGFGLGLWIVKQILDAMGGRISVASTPGHGATFEVLLPLAVGTGG